MRPFHRPFPFHLESRHDIGKLLTLMQLRGNAAEVGVKHGKFSKIILETSNFKKLYSIDLWSNENIKQAAKNNLDPFKERSEIVHKESTEASKLFPDHFFDFVYIDADHSYESVKTDLRHWWPKVKTGGVFAGHDYENIPYRKTKDYWVYEFGVIEAVNEFVAEKGLRLQITTKDDYNSWYVYKPYQLLY